MTIKAFDKFLLLMWKNWLLQWRHPLQTTVEILAPVIFSALLVLIRSLVEPTNHLNPTYFNEFTLNNTLPIKYIQSNRSDIMNISMRASGKKPSFIEEITPQFEEQTSKFKPALIYSPSNDYLHKIVMNLQEKMNFLSFVKDFESSEEMNQFFISSNLSKFVFCGIQFNDSLKKDDDKSPELTPLMNITLRFPAESRFARSKLIPADWQSNFLFPLYQLPGPRQSELDDGGYPPGYNSERFLTIQHHLSYGIINTFLKKRNIGDYSHLPNITLQRFPYPPYIQDPLLIAMTNFISIVVMLSFVYTSISLVKFVTAEKEKQLKEAMKIMGLPNWLHWLAWFLKSLSFTVISILLIVILLKAHWIPGFKVSIFTNSDASIIFVFMLIYMCTTIMFCFMISVFFSKANNASTMAGLLWFLSYTPYLFLQLKYKQLSLFEKLMACLGSNTAMAYGFQFILMAEGTGEGLQWATMWKPVTPDDTFVIGHVMLMLIFDAIIYFLVTLYIEGVHPGNYGVPLPWNFPFTASYWCGVERYTGVEDVESKQSNTTLSYDIYEEEPHGIPIGVKIKHLRKEFKKKVAVRDLTLNLYEGQITVLLGHNGAGKTTTMSMLTGMYPPTSGTAVIAGHDICKDMTGARDSLGLCPQHNILFDDLTVKEHIYFFGKLKGLNQKEIDHQIEKYIKLLELDAKADALSKTLSGGMKRKLSVIVALCGNSKVVILDEPTAGMDPAARRALWDLLQEEKKNRTMLLSTHFMDEADLLGDRIAIMAGGVMQCCGSSFFLKKRYGVGYHLTIDKSFQCNVMKITELLRKHIPETQVESNVGSELTYLLSENQVSVFEPMLKDLEENKNSLGISNYGISLTTMEEVFMKVGADHGQEEQLNALDMQKNGSHIEVFNENILDIDLNRQSSESTLDMGERLLKGFPLSLNQIYAMMIKKAFSTINARILFIIQIILPVAFLIIALTVVKTWVTAKDLRGYQVKLESYEDPITVINGTNNIFKSNYANIIRNTGNVLVDVQNNSLENYMLMKSDENLPKVRLRYIVGATFEESKNGKVKIRNWFNNQPYHATTLALNLAHNSIIKGLLGEEYNISIMNFPQAYTMDTKINRLTLGNNIGFQIAFNIGFSMAFVTSFYIIFCVRERVSKSKHLQFVSGVNVFIFWITAYIWDMITFIFTSLILICILAIYQEDGFSTFQQLGRLLLALLLFAHATLPITYLASFAFHIPATGYTRMTLVNIFTGVAGYLMVEVLSNPTLKLKDTADVLDWIFLIVPHYGISNAVKNLNSIYSVHKICDMVTKARGIGYKNYLCEVKQQCCDYDDENYFAWKKPGIGRNLIFMSILGLVAFALLIIIEYRLLETIKYFIRGKSKSMVPPFPSNEDDDVTKEREKVNSLSPHDYSSYNLILKDFTKYYKKYLAVQRLTLAVKENECFGLLGINGAGKTSTFRMLTGDETISYGEAWAKGRNLKTSMKEVHKHIGYCPQFDALLDDLTGRETMMMFCLLRGLPRYESRFIVKKLAHEFDIARHIDKRVREYSGGNKRKLSTAVALIGDPYVVYLDEPTTGMDPAAKRFLWNTLCKVRDSGKCIILTSHSMEECEALCTRLAIMVNGNFQCLGSVQHLKSKFSEGYTLTVKVKKQHGIEIQQYEIDPIDKFITEKFPSAILREKYQELLTYYISNTNMPWSQMFGVMEEGKKNLAIEDYSLGQANLEQVFLKFTKHQRNEFNS